MAIYVRLSLLIIGIALVNSQLAATLCREDSQCDSGLFCDTNASSCIQCVNCKEHRREPPARFNQTTCLKSLAECGPCFKGLVKVYQEGSVRATCKTPDAQGYFKRSHLVVWAAALIAILIVIGTFVQVLRTTNVYMIHKKMVFYYTHTFLTETPIANTVPSLPSTADFNSNLLPNTISSRGFDYMTPVDTKYLPMSHPSAADIGKRPHAFLSARIGIDIIAKLNTEKRGKRDIHSMTSIVV